MRCELVSEGNVGFDPRQISHSYLMFLLYSLMENVCHQEKREDKEARCELWERRVVKEEGVGSPHSKKRSDWVRNGRFKL